MCFDVQTSLVTGAIGVAASALAARRGETLFAWFWLSVTSMQFVEAAIHVSQAGCSEQTPSLALWTHIGLLVSLCMQPWAYAIYVRTVHSREVGNLLLMHALLALVLRLLPLSSYLIALSEGSPDAGAKGVKVVDLFSEMRQGHGHGSSSSSSSASSASSSAASFSLLQDGSFTYSSLCVHPGPGGHLAWNHGLVDLSVPFLPHYADVILGIFAPAIIYQPALAATAFLLDPLAHLLAGSDRREGGSVWCALIHVYFIAELILTVSGSDASACAPS